MATSSQRPTHRAQSVRLTSANWLIEHLPGLQADDIAKLHGQGVHTTFDLLRLGPTLEKRVLFAHAIESHLQHVQKWFALADLARVPSVGCDYCGLILHAGVASLTQLAQTPTAQLHRQILKLQVGMMQRRDLCPTVDLVDRWIQQARHLSTSLSQARSIENDR